RRTAHKERGARRTPVEIASRSGLDQSTHDDVQSERRSGTNLYRQSPRPASSNRRTLVIPIISIVVTPRQNIKDAVRSPGVIAISVSQRCAGAVGGARDAALPRAAIGSFS